MYVRFYVKEAENEKNRDEMPLYGLNYPQGAYFLSSEMLPSYCTRERVGPSDNLGMHILRTFCMKYFVDFSETLHSN